MTCGALAPIGPSEGTRPGLQVCRRVCQVCHAKRRRTSTEGASKMSLISGGAPFAAGLTRALSLPARARSNFTYGLIWKGRAEAHWPTCSAATWLLVLAPSTTSWLLVMRRHPRAGHGEADCTRPGSTSLEACSRQISPLTRRCNFEGTHRSSSAHHYYY